MKKIIIIGAVFVIFFIAGYFLLWQQISTQQPEEQKLSDFPEVFKENTVIVIGEKASQIEKESTKAIATNLENLTGNKPKIILSKYIENFKHDYNLIVVGTPQTNPFLEEIYQRTNAKKVTEEYPDEGKGILEILNNPWNEEKAILLVEGRSNEWKTKVGSETLMIYTGASHFGEKHAHIPLKITEGADLEVTAPKRCSKHLHIRNTGRVKLTNIIISIFPTKKRGGVPTFIMGKISELGINESKILNASGPIMWILPNVTTLPNEDCGWIVVKCDQGIKERIAYQATPPPAIPRPKMLVLDIFKIFYSYPFYNPRENNFVEKKAEGKR